MAVFVLDKKKRPLMPCSEKRARLLLERGRAVVHKMYPFTIRLKDRLLEDSELQPVRFKVDPGSKESGIALVREKETINEETGEIKREVTLLSAIHLKHRGHAISEALKARAAYRRNRRNKLRYRKARFDNRTKPEGWLAPSIQHRIDSILRLLEKLRKLAPITALSQELVKFDMQKMENPEVKGTEYQRGTLFGYEVREYLLEKWKHTCAYCCATNVPLEIDHIHPRSKGGTDRVSNLVISCKPCNQKKNNLNIREFLARDTTRLERILRQAKAPLKDASAVNATRWVLFRSLESTGLPLEVSSGGRTKYNRTLLGIPKTHALDAACIGYIDIIKKWEQPTLIIECKGRGQRQRTLLDKYGFPRAYLTRQKRHLGFQTGDMVKAVVTTGKRIGKYFGRVSVRKSGYFSISGVIDGVSHRFFTILQRSDGYSYSTKIAN